MPGPRALFGLWVDSAGPRPRTGRWCRVLVSIRSIQGFRLPEDARPRTGEDAGVYADIMFGVSFFVSDS